MSQLIEAEDIERNFTDSDLSEFTTLHATMKEHYFSTREFWKAAFRVDAAGYWKIKGYNSFESYFRTEFEGLYNDLSKAFIYRKLTFERTVAHLEAHNAEVVRVNGQSPMGDCVPIPENERQVRALSGLSTDLQIAVMQEAAKIADADNSKKLFRQGWEETKRELREDGVLAPEPPKPSAPAPSAAIITRAREAVVGDVQRDVKPKEPPALIQKRGLKFYCDSKEFVLQIKSGNTIGAVRFHLSDLKRAMEDAGWVEEAVA